MKHAAMTRAYALGLGYGTLWLIITCMAFALWDAKILMSIPGDLVLSFVGIGLLTSVLLFLCLRFMRKGYALPRGRGGKTSVNGQRLFGILIVAEMIAIATLNILLLRNNEQVWLIPVDLLIVGVHFIPLSFVFQVPAYLFMGGFWLVALLGIMVLLPSTVLLNNVSAWYSIPSLACIGITWLTVLFLMTTETKRIALVS